MLKFAPVIRDLKNMIVNQQITNIQIQDYFIQKNPNLQGSKLK